MKKKIVFSLLLCLGVFMVAGCDLKSNKPEDVNAAPTTTTTKEAFTEEYAYDVLRTHFNNEEGINFHLLDTVTKDGKQYYKIDVRKLNEGGANSRLDIYYVSIEDYGKEIIDQEAFNKN